MITKKNPFRRFSRLIRRWLETTGGRHVRKPLIHFVRYRTIKPGGNDNLTVVAQFAGLRIGETTLSRIWEEEGIDEIFSGGTDVHFLFRGIGVGKGMLRIALLEAKEASLCPVYVNTSYDNQYSIELYRKMGFRIVERTDMSAAIERSYLRRLGETKPQTIMKYDP